MKKMQISRGKNGRMKSAIPIFHILKEGEETVLRSWQTHQWIRRKNEFRNWSLSNQLLIHLRFNALFFFFDVFHKSICYLFTRRLNIDKGLLLKLTDNSLKEILRFQLIHIKSNTTTLLSKYHWFRSWILVAEFFFIVNQPFDGGIDTGLHILLFLISELKDALRSVPKSLLNIKLYFLKYFALNILLNFLLGILSLFESLIQNFVITPQNYHQVEPLRWKYCWTVKINNNSSILNFVLLFDEVYQHILVEDGDIKIIVPFVIKFVLLDELSNGEVLEVEGLVE